MSSRQPVGAKKRRWVEFDVQGSLLKAAVRGGPASGGGPRGPIGCWSRASRKRCIEQGLRLRKDALGSWVTLTYQDPVPSMRLVERDRQQMFKAVKYRFPESSAQWGKGVESTGERLYHPHLAFALFGVTWWAVDELQRLWSEVTGGRGGYVWIESLRGGQVAGYLARYISKEVMEGSLDYAAYLTGDEYVGRWWGVMGRDHLPLAERVKVVLHWGTWLLGMKSAARDTYRWIGEGMGSGFTLFVADPYTWVALAEVLAGDPEGSGALAI